MDFKDVIESKYQELLSHYLNELTETALYQGQKFSRKAIAEQIPLRRSSVFTGRFFRIFFLMLTRRC